MLGVTMMMVHAEGFWADRDVFEAGMRAHNAMTGVGKESDAMLSALDTAGQGLGILMKNVGIGAGAKAIFGTGNGYGFSQGVRNGLTPNRKTYDDWGHNGLVEEGGP